ncbi:hypothetical protein SAMN05216411_10746 [Nitrosospira multiformis]|nr:hypothetical protein SAMN05216411_10746 [Nitrosospira multiformis]
MPHQRDQSSPSRVRATIVIQLASAISVHELIDVLLTLLLSNEQRDNRHLKGKLEL